MYKEIFPNLLINITLNALVTIVINQITTIVMLLPRNESQWYTWTHLFMYRQAVVP